MGTISICTSICLGADLTWLTNISLRPTLQEHCTPKLSWACAIGMWSVPRDRVLAVSTAFHQILCPVSFPSGQQFWNWRGLGLQRSQVEDECICKAFAFTFWQPSHSLRAWSHWLPIWQKCGDSAVFITVSTCLQEILKENLRMFELVQKHPSHWPPFVPPAKPEVTTTGAGKWLFRGSVASRPTCSNCFVRQKQLSD